MAEMSATEKAFIVDDTCFGIFRKEKSGDVYFYPFPERKRRELHLSIHQATFSILQKWQKKNSSENFLKTLMELFPKQVHLSLGKGIRLPHSYKEIEDGFIKLIGMWNEQWSEEEFLLFPSIEETMKIVVGRSFKEESGRIFVKPDFLVPPFEGLRVIGGREIEKDIPKVSHKELVFHPYIGRILYPLVFIPFRELPQQLNGEEMSRLSDLLDELDELWIKKIEKTMRNICESLLECIYRNYEVYSYFKNLEPKVKEGSFPPPKEFPYLQNLPK